jgi:arylsulfatase A-like enzyme
MNWPADSLWRRRPVAIGLLMVWLGLTAGMVEVVWRLYQKFGKGMIIHAPLDIVWMAPLIDLLWLVVPALVVLLGCVVFARRFGFGVVVAILTGFAALPVVLLVPTLHKLVAVLLAAALGLQFGRLAASKPGVVTRLVSFTLPVIAAFTLVVSVWAIREAGREERRALEARSAPPSGKPNVLLLVWDTVRDQSVSVSGYERPTTPFLETMARDGVRFERAISTAPWTLPSHGSIFTGQWPFVFYRGTGRSIQTPTPTLAQLLGGAGYATAGFTANLVYTTREQGLAAGFQHYEDFPRTLATAAGTARIGYVLLNQQWFRHVINYYDVVPRKRASEINASFFRWNDARQDGRPFFVFLNYFDAHHPYIAPEPFRSAFVRPTSETYEVQAATRDVHPTRPGEIAWMHDHYDGLIASMDDATRQLVEGLASRGLLDNTIVIVTSDHGEQFGEHGRTHHMNSLYREALQVPLLVRYPATVPRGRVVGDPVSLRDLPRTVLALSGNTTTAPVPGQSLARFWGQGAAGPDSLVMAELSVMRGRQLGLHAVLSNWLHYIRNAGNRDSLELYNVHDDPLQSTSLHLQPEQMADVAHFRRLSDSLDALYQQSRAGASTPTEDEDDGDEH